MAARNEEKLKTLRNELAEANPNVVLEVDILTADAQDTEALRSVAAQGHVLLCTTGPFAKLGTPVVEACLAAGTHYCDITGHSRVLCCCNKSTLHSHRCWALTLAAITSAEDHGQLHVVYLNALFVCLLD